MFYKTQDGTYHKIFDKQQLTSAMITLMDTERHTEHDNFNGYLVLYHSCDRYFIDYKNINFGGKLFSDLTQKPTKVSGALAALNAVSTTIETKLERVCKVLENEAKAAKVSQTMFTILDVNLMPKEVMDIMTHYDNQDAIFLTANMTKK